MDLNKAVPETVADEMSDQLPLIRQLPSEIGEMTQVS
jgi:hypothetical protein